MDFDYFYEEQSESYSFYRIPKQLFTEIEFERLSVEAKLLYGLLLDRICLSRKNNWVDKSGHVYVYFTIDALKKSIRCGNTKACRLLKELDDFGLIERKNQGQGKPAIIYVKNFCRFPKREMQNSQSENPGVPKAGNQDFSKWEGNNTKTINNEINNTNPIISVRMEGKDVDNSDFEDRQTYKEILTENLEIGYQYQKFPHEWELIDSIVELMLDVICSKRKTIRIAGDDKPVEVVKSQFLKLNMFHMEYIVENILKSSSDIRNIKQYMLAVIYNAPLTIDGYFRTLVNHDMAEGKI